MSLDLDELLGSAYARAVGVDQRSLEALVAEVREAIVAEELSGPAVIARRAALRRVEVRCIVSRVQGQFLDKVLAS